MEGNKDEALRCVGIAKEAIVLGNKEKAFKFIKIAKRLDPGLSLDVLLAACEVIDSDSKSSFGGKKCKDVGDDMLKSSTTPNEGQNGEKNYTEEQVQLVRRIKRNNDHYAVLGLEKDCSVEVIRKAYRKLSLKVHPDKNKAPDSEEAFKKVSKAFTCLNNEDSRRQYDQVGLVGGFEHVQRQSTGRRRRRYNREFSDNNFDPDNVFREFFNQGDMFRASYPYRTRAARNQGREDFHGTGISFITILQILPFLLIFLLAYLPFSEPEYALHKNASYQVPKTTEQHGIDFYVKSPAFDEKFPLGSSARSKIEENVIKDYKNFAFHSCRIELQRRRWNKNMPIPHCTKLQDLGFIERIYG